MTQKKSLELVEHLGFNTIGIHKKLQKTLGVTAVFLAIFVILLLGYEQTVQHVPNLKWDDKVAWNPIFLMAFFSLSASQNDDFHQKYSRLGHNDSIKII